MGRSGLSRRDFLRIGGGAGVGVFFVGRIGGQFFQAPLAGALDELLLPGDIPQFVTPMLIPPVMPRAGTINQRGGKQIDYYEISVKQFEQQILPDGRPKTTVWGYGALTADRNRGLLLHNAPSLTIEARHNRPVRVKWVNGLVKPDGGFLPHLLPVDPTLHWANPPGGAAGRDTRPTFVETPEAYTGPVPIVTHVHGAAGVGDDSDGYAEAWYLPAADNIPDGYATEGTWYDFFRGKAETKYGVEWGPGYATFQYPNLGRAVTNWYHDHTLGMTRLNVYAGPAGFFIIRGGPAGDDAILDSRTGTPAVLPGPAPRENDKFPPNKTYREIPVAIQDRSFNANGSLFYPDTRAFFDEITGPYVPETDISPIWNPEFFGNTIMVNGNTWPFQTVEKCRYRFRFLNGCQSRFLILDFTEIPAVEVWAIGSDGGLLAQAADITNGAGGRLLMAPAERADLIVDFTNVPVGNYVLRNVGPDEPFGGGDFDPADPNTTGQIMQFQVVPATQADPSTPGPFLQLPAIAALPPVTRTRRLALLEEMSMDFADAPAEAQLGTIAEDLTWTAREWAEPVTENPSPTDTEVWELYNATGDAHPIHLHEVTFAVLSRQDIVVDEEARTVALDVGGQPVEIWETGRKDTVTAYPGQVTRVQAQFNTPGQYVWHCHIVEHEDNEMMRPYRVGPEQPGQPAPHHHDPM